MHYMRAQTPDTVLAVTIFDYNIIKPFAAKFASPRRGSKEITICPPYMRA